MQLFHGYHTVKPVPIVSTLGEKLTAFCQSKAVLPARPLQLVKLHSNWGKKQEYLSYICTVLYYV